MRCFSAHLTLIAGAPPGHTQQSFLQAQVFQRRQSNATDDFAVEVSTVAVPTPDDSVQAMIERIEDKRADAEKKFFELVSPLQEPTRVSVVVTVPRYSHRLAMNWKL